MNIFVRELRAGRKAFLFWLLGLFILCFVGIVKYESYTESGSMNELLAAFPRIVLAVMGVSGVDISTLAGYTTLLFYYILLCVVIYAVHLGANAVGRESVDKTYEFLFAKPCSRARILGWKLASAYAFLLVFCACNAVFALLASGTLNTSEEVSRLVALYSLAVFLIGAAFLALAALFAAAARRPERGALWGNLAFLYAFVLGVVYNMLEHPGLLQLIAPFNYFAPADLVAGQFSLPYAGLTLALTAAFLWGAFASFQRKDLV